MLVLEAACQRLTEDDMLVLFQIPSEAPSVALMRLRHAGQSASDHSAHLDPRPILLRPPPSIFLKAFGHMQTINRFLYGPSAEEKVRAWQTKLRAEQRQLDREMRQVGLHVRSDPMRI